MKIRPKRFAHDCRLSLRSKPSVKGETEGQAWSIAMGLPKTMKFCRTSNICLLANDECIIFFVLDHSPRPCCSERLDWGTGNMQSNRLWNGQRREPGKHLRKENKGSCYIQLLLYQFLKSFVSLYLSSVFTICISIF